uniref:Uncharacterized protein n=1 Tax=Panagrolaimus superbus TaxID=310955 RepID=A0A914Z4C2_9BILA
MPDTKEERECITPESIEDSCIIQKEDLQNGYCRSDSLVSKEEQEDNMDKGNDSDSSSVINQDMDEMIVVTKKRRNRIKNNVDNNAGQLPAAPTHSRSLPGTRSRGSDRQRQRVSKSNNDSKLKPLKISTASFDMDQDFPPLNSHPLSATIRREKVQSPPKNVDKVPVHPSKSDSNLAASSKQKLQEAFVENQVLLFSENFSNAVEEITNEDEETNVDKKMEEKVDEQIEKENQQNVKPSKEQCEVNNFECETDAVDQPSEQPGPSYSRNKGRRSGDRRSRSQNTFTSQNNQKHRPRFINSNAGPRRLRYPAFKNYSNNFGYMNPMMNVPYISSTQTASGFPFVYPSASSHGYGYAQLPSLYPYAPTGFVPHQTFLPMHLPYPASNFERFQGPSFLTQYPRGYPVPANGAPPGITKFSGNKNVSSSSTVVSNENDDKSSANVSPATTPVADYNGQRAPSVPVTLSASSRPFGENVKNIDRGHLSTPSAPATTEIAFNIPSSLPYGTAPISAVDSTMAKIADTNISPLSQSPESATSSTTHHATTTDSSNSDPSLVNPSCPRSIDTLTLSPELQKTVCEAFGLQSNEGIFYIYATDEKGEHTRQMRVILHNKTPIKFGKFASPVYLSPTVGPAGVLSPMGFYYAKQEKFSVPSSEGHPSVVHTVTQHHPVLSFSATIPEQYQIPLMPTYYQDVIVLPTPPPPTAPVLSSNPASTPPSTPLILEPTSSSKLSPSACELSSTSSNDTSAQ